MFPHGSNLPAPVTATATGTNGRRIVLAIMPQDPASFSQAVRALERIAGVEVVVIREATLPPRVELPLIPSPHHFNSRNIEREMLRRMHYSFWYREDRFDGALTDDVRGHACAGTWAHARALAATRRRLYPARDKSPRPVGVVALSPTLPKRGFTRGNTRGRLQHGFRQRRHTTR